MGITASAIRAGRAFVELSLEKTKFVRDLRKLQNSLRSTGNYLKGLGNDMMLLGGTGVLPFAGALKMFSDFDDKMRTLKAVTGATDAQMASLRAQTKELGATTAFTASQVGDASVTLARMGLGVNGVKNGLKPMLNLTRATGTETHRVGEAAQFAASTLGQYDLEASKFADICDVMAYAANHSAMDIFDMGEAIKIAGPSAKTVNEDIRDTAASLMLLANAGVRGSLAGTSLRKIYQSLAAQSGKVEGLSKEQIAEGVAGQEQLRQMGISIVDPKTGNLRKAADIMAEMAEKVKDMANGEKINFATDIFDLRGSLGALTMLKNPWDLKKFRQELNSVTGYAQKAAEEIENGPGGMLRLLRSQFEDIAISIGEAVYSVIEPFKDNLKTIASVIKNIVTLNKGLIGNIALVLAGTFALGVVLIAVGIYFKLLAASIGVAIGVMKTFTFVVTLPGRAISAISDGLNNLQKAISALSAAGSFAFNILNKIPTPLFVGKAAIGVFRGAVAGLGISMIALERGLQFLRLGLYKLFYSLNAVKSTGVVFQKSLLLLSAGAKSATGAITLYRGGLVALRSSAITFSASMKTMQLAVKSYAITLASCNAIQRYVATSSVMLKQVMTTLLSVVQSGSTVFFVFRKAVTSISIVTYGASASLLAVKNVFLSIVAVSSTASTALAVYRGSVMSCSAATLAFRSVVNGTLTVFRTFPIVAKAAAVSTAAVSVAIRAATGTIVALKAVFGTLAVVINSATASLVVYKSVSLLTAIATKVLTAAMLLNKAIIIKLQALIGFLKLSYAALAASATAAGIAMNIALGAKLILAVGAVIAVIWALCKIFKELGTILASLGNLMKQAFSGMLQSVKEWGGKVASVVKQTFGLFYEAMLSGDMAAAMKIAMSGLYLAFLQGIEPIRKEWEKFKEGLHILQYIDYKGGAVFRFLVDMQGGIQQWKDVDKWNQAHKNEKAKKRAEQQNSGLEDGYTKEIRHARAQMLEAEKFFRDGQEANKKAQKLKDFFDNSQERYRLHEMSGDQRTLSHLATLEKMKNENPKQAESFLRVYADRIAKQKEVIQEEFDKALEEAKSDRNITAEETQKLQGIAMRFGKASELESRYKQMLENSASTVKSQVGMATGDTKTLGAWSASALGRMWGGAGSPAERTARATERQNKLMEKNNSYLAEMKDGITYA